MSKEARNILIGLLILAALGGYWLFQYFREPGLDFTQLDIHKFGGNIVSIKGETVLVHGVFSGPPEKIPEGLSAPRDFKFKMAGSTRFEKLEIRFPSWAELKAMGKVDGNQARYRLEELPQARKTGSFEDLKNSISRGGVIVEVDFIPSAHDPREAVAAFVFYQVFIEPSSSLAP